MNVQPWVALGGALSLIAACTIVNGLTVPLPPVDAGSPAVDAQVTDPCAHAYPPPEPAPAPQSGDIVFTVVVKAVHFLGNADASVGFDLDDTCTCPEDESCKPFVPRSTYCDQDLRGRDNAMRALAEEVRDVYGFDVDSNANENAVDGASAILSQVQGYNGEPDDPDVRVSMLVSPGLYTVLPDGGTGAPRLRPTFTSIDRWSTLPEEVAVKDPLVVPLRTVRGYVKDYSLVVRTDVTLRFRPGMRMTFPDALVVSHIAKGTDGTFTIDGGTVAVRWPTNNILEVFGAVDEPRGSGNYLCTTPALSAIWAELRKRACEQADIMGRIADDHAGKMCDATSGAFTFEAAPASLGPPRAAPTLEPCGDAGLSCSP